MVRIPNYSSEEPMLFVISLTEFVLGATFMLVGMLFNMQLYAIVASGAFIVFYRKYSEGQMPNYPMHLAYKAGIYRPKSRLIPPPFAMEFYK